MRRIREIQSAGATVLFVSHDVSTVRSLCERAIWIRDGALADSGDVFPVTASYMEHMFHEEGENEPLHAKTMGQPATTELPAPSPGELPPVTRWGSHQGLVDRTVLYGSAGIPTELLSFGEDFEIRIDVTLPEGFDPTDLSVAFSIKDLKGTDLVVGFEEISDLVLAAQPESISVRFCSKNILSPGKYIVVTALERRKGKDIHYYEYIEGSYYFSCLADFPIYGLFLPDINADVIVRQRNIASV
jgi:lipopolysaccharide transport system ATP-binding protein